MLAHFRREEIGRLYKLHRKTTEFCRAHALSSVCVCVRVYVCEKTYEIYNMR